MTTISRVAAGTTAGGEFASHNRSEADVTLLSIDDLAIDKLDTPHPQGGYDEVHSDITGFRAYFRDGKLHNEAGPAFCEGHSDDPTGARQLTFLNGEQQYAPDESLRFTGMEADENGVKRQVWSSEGSRVVYVAPDGRTTFTRDGDIDRAGAPAITGGNGPDIWMRYDKVIANPIPAIPTATQREADGNDYLEYQGEKFEPGATTAERAMRIREDIDKAIYAGILGTEAGLLAKSAVTTLGKPGVEGKPQTLYVVYDPASRTIDPVRERGPGDSNRLTAKGQEITRMLTDIVNSHNKWEYGPGATEGHQAFDVRVELA